MISYTINFTSDTKTPFVIPPGEYNGPNHLLESPPRPTKAHTSLNLPGAGTIRYGEMINEDLVHILENFYNVTPPPLPTYGQIWTSDNNHVHVYASSNRWSRMPIVNPDPSNAIDGDIQVVDGRIYIYGDGRFVEIGGSALNPCAVNQHIDWGFTSSDVSSGNTVDWGLTTDVVTEVADWGGRCTNDIVVDWGYTNQIATQFDDWGDQQTDVTVTPDRIESWGYTAECQPIQQGCMQT